ncbi:thiol reductant ABC exporter subunit CydC [Bifidobacterium sp. ESL0763]|uniref:thiol reductant ABC exporter subunit CydC n=1 Tax=Bifidobacterium sp. ESL0763 TaxID=2983227 RepID=UPI0023F74EAC|nr:thiol reductant ABC exporter subunit CydC [Bifidobacterium sp. ESL0763]MDF7663525.1 thiol reductant ABC exporter subunit CydC [Bifidobacterium sp. ESL0763]
MTPSGNDRNGEDGLNGKAMNGTGTGEAQVPQAATPHDGGKVRLRDYLKVWEHDHWFWPYLKENRRKLVLIFFLGLMTFVCAAALMFTAGYLINRSARMPYNILLVYVPIVLTRAFGIGRPVFKYVEQLKSHDWVLHVISKLRVQLYRTLSKDAAFLNEHERTGSVLSLLADDLDHLENFYLRTIFPTVVAYVLWVVVTIAMGVFSWTGALLLFVMLALVLVLIPLVSLSFSTGHFALEKQQQAQEYTKVTESYLGLSDWVITHKGDEFASIGANEYRRIQRSQDEQKAFERWRNFAIQVVFGVIAVGLMVGAAMTMTGSKSMADWSASIVLAVFPLVDCFINVAQAAAEVPLYSDSLKHLNDLTERVESRQGEPVAQQSLDGPIESIDFDHVTFAYGPGQPTLLDDFTLHIGAGRKVALLGPSGEGKTTILQLLLGDLEPQSGSITINGIPVAALQDERARIFGYLNQQAFLFNTTIAQNVRLGAPDASDEDVWAALKAVRLDETVRALADGIDTSVDESGQRFSGGQRQRIALARIVLKDTPVILLDEPTIGLDPITERDLMAMIFDAAGDRSMLWVTHHLQGLEQADEVVFLEDGRIAMQGAPAELYRTNTRFRELYKLDVGDLEAVGKGA